jgi:hypothetical protein
VSHIVTRNDIRELSDEFRQKYVVDVQGKDFVLFDGLMALAHAEGPNTPIRGIRTTILQMPTPPKVRNIEEERDEIDPNTGKVRTLKYITSDYESYGEFEMTCVVQAEVTDKNGNVWTGIGDASPNSVSKRLTPALIRMAETRAIGRALRMMLGVGTMVEELENPYAVPMITDIQADKIKYLMKTKGLSKEFVGDLAFRYFNVRNAVSLTESQAEELIRMLENDMYDDEDHKEAV